MIRSIVGWPTTAATPGPSRTRQLLGPRGVVHGQVVSQRARHSRCAAVAASAVVGLCQRWRRTFCRAAQAALAPSSRSQFVGESEVRLSDEDVERNARVHARAQLPSSAAGLFRAHKESILSRTLLHDRSPKGSVDARIVGILNTINSRPDYVTTSSCSGRVLFISYDCHRESSVQGAHTHTGRWRISHDGIAEPREYFSLDTEPLRGSAEDLWLLVQGMELQVACASIADANRLIAVAKNVFQRAYIKSASREWKTLVQVKGSQRLEMPFALQGRQVYSGSHEQLAEIVNAKLRKNWRDMDLLLEHLQDL